MKLKKFVVGIVASALVVASMATTVLASGSPETGDITPVITAAPSGGGNTGGRDSGTSKSGSGKSSSGSSKSSGGSSTGSKSNEADIFASNISGDIIKYDGGDVDAYAAVLKKLTNDIIASARALGTGGILKAVDVTDSKGHLYNATVTIRFRSPAFKAGMKITALHLPDGSSTWEKLKPDSVSDGECVVTFPNGLSPVVFTAEGVSDKTGESAPILPILAAICLAGAVFFGTKMRFAK